jgi:hypothetical protein
MLIAEGMFYTFSHRSFQEYFAAYCLAYVTKRNFEKFARRFSTRMSDSALDFLQEMNPESYRDLYVLPLHSQYSHLYDRKSRPSDARFLAEISGSLSFVITPRTTATKSRLRAVAMLLPNSEPSDAFSYLQRMARESPKYRPIEVFQHGKDHADEALLEELFSRVGRDRLFTATIAPKDSELVVVCSGLEPDAANDIELADPDLMLRFMNSRTFQIVDNLRSCAAATAAEYVKKSAVSGDALDELITG